MSGAAASVGYSTAQRSNTELVNCLRVNFENAIIDSEPETDGNGEQNGTGAQNGTHSMNVDHRRWTATMDEGKTICIPALDYNNEPLQEEREQYDITAKLFYLPNASPTHREKQTREALDLVLKGLKMPSIDLLIVSFPGIYFDEVSEDCPDKISSRGPIEAEPESLDKQIDTWQILERLHDEGLVKRLGLSEFGAERLQPFLEKTRIRPAVDQINLRDCCSVPKPLMSLAKSNQIELLVHNDCTNVLPRGTLREILGQGEDGAGVLSAGGEKLGKRKERDGEESAGTIKRDVVPQWVIKYTAVIQNRGVIENKGYYAVAEVQG